jgi:enamine deaminase RidA (YjgF/YER057c/UK114 family)
MEAAEGTVADILQCTIYITDISHWTEVNGIYGALFQDVPVLPARAVVPIKEMHWCTHRDSTDSLLEPGFLCGTFLASAFGRASVPHFLLLNFLQKSRKGFSFPTSCCTFAFTRLAVGSCVEDSSKAQEPRFSFEPSE